MLSIVIIILASYLLGSVSGSILVGKLMKVDIRAIGSGNAGGTNAFRTQGFLFALPVILIDIGKGYVATHYFSSITFLSSQNLLSSDLIPLLCGCAAVLGHCYPAFHGFQGGKGAGTAIGMLISVFPQTLIPAIGIWILTLILTGYVGLGTMLAGITVAVTANFFPPENTNLYLNEISLALMLFLIFTHRSNISRMLNGNENRFEKIMIFGNRK